MSLLLVLGGVAVAAAPQAAADTYRPRPGALLNNPMGGSFVAQKINRHLLRAIYSTPRNTRIRVMSWNVRSHAAAKALVRAHRRGVTVQLLMDKINTVEHDVDPDNPIPAPGDANPDFHWMKREFRRNNNRRPGYRSWARVCNRSCRGTSGLPHTKMFIFDWVHTQRHVVMYGSGNLTGAAASAQWNDIYTSVGREGMWRFANRRFEEMSFDRPMGNPWKVASFGAIRFGFFPWSGAGTTGDPVLRVLNQVSCLGALPGAGNSAGRTVIKINQTAISDARGRAIARKLKSLWNSGCQVRILYGLMGQQIKTILRSASGRGPVPIRQMVQDFDGDFVYDRYLHQKSMTISGVWSGSRRANYVWNGSANWAGYTLPSDEIFTRIGSRSLVLQYNDFNNYWFSHAPRSARGVMGDGYARFAGIDPYAKFELH